MTKNSIILSMEVRGLLIIVLFHCIDNVMADERDRCYPLTQPFCRQLGFVGQYNVTSISSIDQRHLRGFRQMHSILRSECSPNLIKFMCAAEVPLCMATEVDLMGIPEVVTSPKPCRSLCLEVYRSCARMLRIRSRPWPRHLLCDKFPLREDNCIGSGQQMVDFMSRPLNDYFDKKLWAHDFAANGCYLAGDSSKILEFILPDDISNVVKMEFKTNETDGIVAVAHSKRKMSRNSIYILLEDGKLVYQFQCNDRRVVYSNQQTQYNDGHWHEVDVPLTWSILNNVSSSLDTISRDEGNRCSEEISRLRIGSLTDGNQEDVQSHPFKGCVRNVNIDGEVPRLSSNSQDLDDGSMVEWQRCPE